MNIRRYFCFTDGVLATGSKEETVKALLSIHQALRKASGIISSSNKVIMEQIDQLKSQRY